MASIDQQIIAVSRTAYGVALQTMKYLGLPFNLVPNTTLNEKLGIQAGVLPSAGVMPNLAYMCIGNLGHDATKAADGSWETIPLPHRANDSGLFGMIPFVLREVTDDLPANMRRKYRLRRQEPHNGKQYFAYYGRKIDLTGVTVQLQKTEKVNGVITVTPYVPSSDDLNPTPPAISNTGTVVGSDSSVSASAIIQVVMTAEDIAEIINAHRIRTGSTRSPVISELTLCTGVDKDVSGASGSTGSFTYTEVVVCQANIHISTNHPIGYTSNGATLNLDVGGVEPMLAENSLNAATFLN